MATDIGRVGMVMKGNWNSSATYEVLDVVQYNSGTFIAKQAVPANTVPTNTTYWQPAINSAIIGTTDISGIADGTLTGAVSELGRLHFEQQTVTTDSYGQFYYSHADDLIAAFVINIENAFAVKSSTNALRIYAGSNASTTNDPIKMIINTEVKLNILYYD